MIKTSALLYVVQEHWLGLRAEKPEKSDSVIGTQGLAAALSKYGRSN
jgi:hypothetical protein